MKTLGQQEGYTNYLPHIKCSKLFCQKRAVFKKLTIKFPVIMRYEPRCEKHK